MPVKIGIDARMIKSSGIGRVIENVLKYIISRNKNWNFILLGKKDEFKQYDFSRAENVRIIECRSSIYSCLEQIELYRKIPKEVDAFWSPHYNIPLLYKGKLIVTIHDVFHLEMLHGFKNIHKKMYAKFLFYCISKKADRIICVSQFTAKQLQKHINIREDKINVIYNGIDERWFHVKKRKRPYLKKYILYVGNIKPHKNLLRLLRAFQLIKEKAPYDLILVGKKDGFITEDKEIKQLAMYEKRVVFTGYVSDSMLEQYFIHADVFVFPSLYEGFGLPPLEALACGCPVVASNIESIIEVCKENVVYFDPYEVNDIADKLLLLLTNRRRKTRKHAMEIIDFKWIEKVKIYESIIKNTIQVD